ncbi:hypothetical protein A3A66_03865 [Microgenomates group bacterium RIFCSPLOWO2_01_FULL_46_13]|nr:MAG: hypothetical protein A2783_01350 [Microgenomates group bacterium RIFCSPHIGHO2_01_FULL_45_11]OGV94927.1 MAG: hypothetical protein A3A66_03865 [Microgenomates group bacterium RIFCSPLOWO2_01_FULL_46_13]
MPLEEELDRFKAKFDRQLEIFLIDKINQHRQVDPVLADMTKRVAKRVLRGGKRIRPLLIKLAYDLAGGKDSEKIIKAGIAIELLHQYLLTHDDIIDRDQIRYGGDTLEVDYHKLFQKKFNKTDPHLGLSLGIIAGDHLHTLALDALTESGFPAESIIKAVNWLNQILYDTVAGFQITYFQNHLPIAKAEETDYLKGILLVSGRYTIEAPLMLGLILADNTSIKSALHHYSQNVGLGFQMQDDILGLFGNTKTTGKPVGNDIREGKKTLLLVKTYKRVNSEEKKFLQKCVGKNITQIQLRQIQHLVKKSGTLKECQNLAKDYVKKGKRALFTLKVTPSQATTLLTDIADFLITRSK